MYNVLDRNDEDLDILFHKRLVFVKILKKNEVENDKYLELFS